MRDRPVAVSDAPTLAREVAAQMSPLFELNNPEPLGNGMIRMHTMLGFASRVNEPGFFATDDEMDDLHLAGFGDDDIWDIAAIASFFGFSTERLLLM